jgi:hypothetical protein
MRLHARSFTKALLLLSLPFEQTWTEILRYLRPSDLGSFFNDLDRGSFPLTTCVFD